MARLPYHCLHVLVDEFTERANGVWIWKALEAQEDVFEFLAAVVVVDRLDDQAVVALIGTRVKDLCRSALRSPLLKSCPTPRSCWSVQP